MSDSSLESGGSVIVRTLRLTISTVLPIWITQTLPQEDAEQFIAPNPSPLGGGQAVESCVVLQQGQTFIVFSG
jgi:hypothetical protein